jgi:hypothetical protein
MGMYFLARRWTRNNLAAAVAGGIFAFNGMTWYATMWTSTNAALGWMPWVVLASEEAWHRGGRAILVAGLVAGMQALSGGAEVILLTWLSLAVLWAVQCWSRKDSSRWTFTARFLFASLIALGLSAAQLGPFLDLLFHSERSAEYENPAMGAMPLTGWANFLVPLFHCLRNPQGLFVQTNHWTGSYYLGVATIALALFGCWRVRSSRVWALAGLAVFSLTMAPGDRALLYAVAKRLFPLLGFIRFSVKFVMLATFAIPLLAAHGVASLETNRNQTSRFPRGLAGITIGLLLIMGLLMGVAWQSRSPGDNPLAMTENGLVRGLFFVPIMGCLGWLSRISELQSSRLAQTGLIVLLWFDVFTHNGDLSPTIPASRFQPDAVRQNFNWDDGLRAGGNRLIEGRLSYQTMLSASFPNLDQDTASRRLAQFFNFNLLDHAPKFDSLFPLNLRDFKRIEKRFYASRGEVPGLLDFMSISQISNPTNIVDWTPRRTWLPLISGGQRVAFANANETLEALFDHNFGPREIVYFPVAAQGVLKASARAAVQIRAVKFSPCRIEFEVETGAPTAVSVAQTFYHCWHAYVDGQRTQLWPANLAFQGLEVPIGKHRVELVYEDIVFKIGGFLSAVSLLTCVIGWFILRKSEAKREKWKLTSERWQEKKRCIGPARRVLG